jgi:hypothetical protein
MRKRSAHKTNQCTPYLTYYCNGCGPDCYFRKKAKDNVWHCDYFHLPGEECDNVKARRDAYKQLLRKQAIKEEA